MSLYFHFFTKSPNIYTLYICICAIHHTKYTNANANATADDGGKVISVLLLLLSPLLSFYNFNSIQFISHWLAVSPLLRKRHINLIVVSHFSNRQNLSVLHCRCCCCCSFFDPPTKKHLYETNQMKWHKNGKERIDQSSKKKRKKTTTRWRERERKRNKLRATDWCIQMD